MWMLILNVVYVLVAIAIIALVLMQRGSGAQAGSGFGAGASGTVFGARGASNFLSKSTKWLAIAFFGISLFMAWYATHSARPAAQQNLGVMSQLPAAAEAPVGELPKPSTVPSTPIQQAPAAPAAPAGDAPAAPQQAAPASEQPPVTPPQGG
ncbi:preprotein translocase subunit SecG [Pseudoxanthomonas mexicana]|jgi:preprotein translocase subunit SecG|uniref:preprotein translocase subunit SecG n=1 Tax=Pseudoxanthomonas mexicana TaxID=128785 RepID=UPI0022F39A28|nr:preprotein translocase subunit SecG [Pseudoxanthomonas mexicana]WBX92677.1 preprotein translocase subunit SecG [Pseudoxanthomonas mexicana]